MRLRQHFDERLDEIRSDVLRMGGMACDMVRMAVDAAMNGEIELAGEVIRSDDEVDFLEDDTVNRAVLLVMQEAPVGRDLRFLAATLGIIGEIEKVADDACKLARRSTKLQGSFPAEMKSALLEIGEQARQAFASSLRLYAEYDDALATQIIKSDKEIDGQYKAARNRLFELIKKNPDATEHLVRTIEIFHALEHVADHAVEIAGRLKLHYSETPPLPPQPVP
ncbi:MAG TPA: phosphate signaling complex protein PhoU [Fimbriimonadaceae bacterium]|nr:phosphate signaling complex protein PhoU [Fimbriimonadaceae bacterium]